LVFYLGEPVYGIQFVVADSGVESGGKRFRVVPERYRIEAKSEMLAGSPDPYLEIVAKEKESVGESIMTREITLRLYEGDVVDIVTAALGAKMNCLPHIAKIKEAIVLLQAATGISAEPRAEAGRGGG
jgi:hypothetical protein